MPNKIGSDKVTLKIGVSRVLDGDILALLHKVDQ